MNKSECAKYLKAVSTLCEQQNLRLTDARRFVLEIIAASDKPIVAYDILAQLAKKMPNPKPPTAYRAIEFLQQNQFIHRIESLNAYIVCAAAHRHEGSQFMICDDCGTVTEAHLCHLPTPINNKIADAGFHMNSWNLELHGTCKNCTPRGARSACHTHDHL